MSLTEEREHYYPVLYVEPLLGNATSLGFDLGSNPQYLAVIEKSRDSHAPIISEKINLAQHNTENKNNGVLLVYPIYKTPSKLLDLNDARENLIGFTLSIIQMPELMSNLLISSNFNSLQIPAGVDL